MRKLQQKGSRGEAVGLVKGPREGGNLWEVGGGCGLWKTHLGAYAQEGESAMSCAHPQDIRSWWRD